MLMLSVGKRLLPSDAAVRDGDWDYRYRSGLQQLGGKTIGIVGWGTIGRLTASIAAHGFGMRVLVYSPAADPATIEAQRAVPCSSLTSLLQQSDVVSLHRPSRDDTFHMIDANALSLMKPTAILVNTARAELVDTVALTEALRGGRLAGAGLDVFEQEPVPIDHPLRDLRNVVLTPHTGGSTDEALEVTALQCAEQIIEVLANRKPAYLVNPQVWDTRRV
jgi:D-3-phosphoglycerate dehydrogenase